MITIAAEDGLSVRNILVIIGLIGCYLFWSWVGIHVWDFLLFDIMAMPWPFPFEPFWR